MLGKLWALWQGIVQLWTLGSPQPVEATDDAFWDQFWADTATSVQDVFALVPAAEIRAVREESPSNLATLCYKVRVPGPPATPSWAICHPLGDTDAGPLCGPRRLAGPGFWGSDHGEVIWARPC